MWFLYRGAGVDSAFDPHTSATNPEKHGINFAVAQILWDDPMRVEIPARSTEEPRWLVIGQVNRKCRSAVVTYREQRIRIISVRHARKEEVAIYEG